MCRATVLALSTQTPVVAFPVAQHQHFGKAVGVLPQPDPDELHNASREREYLGGSPLGCMASVGRLFAEIRIAFVGQRRARFIVRGVPDFLGLPLLGHCQNCQKGRRQPYRWAFVSFGSCLGDALLALRVQPGKPATHGCTQCNTVYTNVGLPPLPTSASLR